MQQKIIVKGLHERPSMQWFRHCLRGEASVLRETRWIAMQNGHSECLAKETIFNCGVEAYCHLLARCNDVLKELIQKAKTVEDAHPYFATLTGIPYCQAEMIKGALARLGARFQGEEVFYLPIGDKIGKSLERCLSLNHVSCPSDIRRPLTPEFYTCCSNPDSLGHFLENNIVFI